MDNQKIADMFFEMADVLEMQNVAWKPIAYRRAARTIAALKKDIREIYSKGGLNSLKEIPWVGEHIADKIAEFLDTGKINAYEKLIKKAPKQIILLTKIPGIGVKKVKRLNKELGIKTVEQLKKAAESHKIRGITGFGEKSEKDILEGILRMKESKGRIPLKQAQNIANKLINSLKKAEIKQISTAGSLRRKKESVGDIDILASSDNALKVIEFFVGLKIVDKVLAKGDTKATVILKSGEQVDLRVVKPNEWGAGLFYFTGSKNYNIETRKIAIKKGYKLSEYGLFDKKTGKRVAGETEEGICRILGIKHIKPEEREI